MNSISETIFLIMLPWPKEYERLKLDLQKRYEHDRDAYTSNKAAS